MPVEEILKLAEYKFTHIPEKFECDFDFEKKDCSIFVTFNNIKTIKNYTRFSKHTNILLLIMLIILFVIRYPFI